MKLTKDSIKQLATEIQSECTYWIDGGYALDEVAVCVYLEKLNFTFQPDDQSQSTLIAEAPKKK